MDRLTFNLSYIQVSSCLDKECKWLCQNNGFFKSLRSAI